MSGRALRLGAVVVAGGAGYYLYRAGGDPKAAQKRAEADAAKLSNEVKANLPGDAKEAKKDVESGAADANAKINQWAKEAKSGVDKADAKLDQYRQEASKSFDKHAKDAESGINKAIDKFDQTVSQGADKAKSGVSGWFGGSSNSK